MNCKLRVAALNDEPMDGTSVHNSTNLTSVFGPGRYHALSPFPNNPRAPASRNYLLVLAEILLLPTPTQSFVELDETAILISPRRSERQFGAVK
jgi:hypothetical protein